LSAGASQTRAGLQERERWGTFLGGKYTEGRGHQRGGGGKRQMPVGKDGAGKKQG